jgi:hypothetical protein
MINNKIDYECLRILPICYSPQIAKKLESIYAAILLEIFYNDYSHKLNKHSIKEEWLTWNKEHIEKQTCIPQKEQIKAMKILVKFKVIEMYKDDKNEIKKFRFMAKNDE